MDEETGNARQSFESDYNDVFSVRKTNGSARSSIRLSKRKLSRNYSVVSTRSGTHADEITRRGDAVRLTWKNVNVYVEKGGSIFSRKKKNENVKQILYNVSGFADAGNVMAIMGSSGAGKSTLLNALTWRNRQNLKIEGEIKVNGLKLEDKITNVSAYVQQDDLFVGAMTVKEHLIFNARLRMDPAVSDSDRFKRVDEVMDQMGLRKCESTGIGTPGKTKTISGGEMKRLSFATELLTNPPLLFCDEPTSGLDSYLAKVICECLQRVAKDGCTVLCTIHQPSSEVFELFDKLLLLALGRVIYLGPRQDAETYYSSLGIPCPRNFNPADHYIMKISVTPGNEQYSKDKIAKIADQYEASDNKLHIDSKIDEDIENDYQTSDGFTVEKASRYKVNQLQQFYALLGRAAIMIYRDPLVSRVKLGQTIVVALIIGLVYLRTPYGKEYQSSEITDISGAIFLVIINNTFSYIFAVINTFPTEIPLFRREHFNGMYSTLAYYLSKNVAELPMYFVLPLIYSSIVYFMIGLYPGAAQFFIFYGVMVLLINTCVSFGYWVSCMSPTVTIALAIGPPMIMPLLLFGGFFLSADSVPVYFIWLKYLSWFLYTNEILTINQWQDVDSIACDASGNRTCSETNGAQVIEAFGFDTNNLGMDIGLLFALLFFYRILGFLILLYRMRDSTR